MRTLLLLDWLQSFKNLFFNQKSCCKSNLYSCSQSTPDGSVLTKNNKTSYIWLVGDGICLNRKKK